LLSALLILAPPVAGYALAGPVGVIGGVLISICLTSKLAWSLLLEPPGGSRLARLLVGECAVCAPADPAGSLSLAIRKAEAEAFLKYGSDARSTGR